MGICLAREAPSSTSMVVLGSRIPSSQDLIFVALPAGQTLLPPQIWKMDVVSNRSAGLLLSLLPHECIHDILLNYLDGKSISTLLLVTLKCEGNWSIRLQNVARQRLERILTSFADANDEDLATFLREILSTVESTSRNEGDQIGRGGLVSRMLAVTDYVERSFPKLGCAESIVPKFPSWIDTLQCSSPRCTLKVQYLFPRWSWKVSATARIPTTTTQLIREPRRFKMVPPFGLVKCIEQCNESSMRKLVDLMNEQNMVLCQRIHRSTSPHTFFVTGQQACEHCPAFLRTDPYRFKQGCYYPNSLFAVSSRDEFEVVERDRLVDNLIFILKNLDNN